MKVGMILGDVSTDVPAQQHMADLLRQVEAAQRNGISLFVVAHHFLYGDLRCLQPVPTIARLSSELDKDTKIGPMTIQAPLVHPVQLAEDLATLDIVTEGRLVVGLGAGYREDEFPPFGIPFHERFGRLTESIELIRKLWSEEKVTHHGKYYDVDGVLPHLRPVQQPNPPIWVGASRDQGVRRSARIADAWPIVPEVSHTELRRLLAVYEDERERVGRPNVKHPARREIVPGRTTDEAYDRFESMAKQRLMTYAKRSLKTRNADELESAFREVAEREAFVGTPAEIVEKVTALAAEAPIDQVIVRASWPSMSVDDVIDYLDDLGRDVIPALAPITSVDRVDRSGLVTSDPTG